MENYSEHSADTAIENLAKGAETRKEWTAPQLKKIDIEVLTANGGFLAADGMTSS